MARRDYQQVLERTEDLTLLISSDKAIVVSHEIECANGEIAALRA
jgi:hypothetical protein